MIYSQYAYSLASADSSPSSSIRGEYVGACVTDAWD